MDAFAKSGWINNIFCFSNVYVYVNIKLLSFIVIIGIVFPFFIASAEMNDRHIELHEVVVRPGKTRYSKKNNPAVDFIEQVMARRHMTDPRLTHSHYQYGLYERMQLGVCDFKVDSAGALGFLNQYMDTSAISGRSVLNLTVKEKISDVYYRRSPSTVKEVVRLRNRHGLDDLVADAASLQTVFEEVLRPVDLYESDDIMLMRQKFVSPLGRLATDFYKFYLSDTVADADNGDSLVVVSFIPHNPAMPSFNGRIYVVKGDSTMFIRKAEMRLPKEANVNFVSDMYLLQEYDRAPDGSRLKTRDEIIVEASYLTARAYASRLSIYNSHSFAPPADSTLFSDPREVIERNDLGESIVGFRPSDTGRGAANMDRMIADLRTNGVFRWCEKIIRTLVSNYIRPWGTDSKIAIGPIFSIISKNGLEGWRLRLGGMTTAALSPRIFVSGYAAYGFKDRRWKYAAQLEYSFINKKQHSGEFPIRSLQLSHTYDVDRPWQKLDNSDAFFNSLSRTSNNLMTYRRQTALGFTYETYANLAVNISLTHTRQEESPYVPFVDGNMNRYGSFKQTALTLDLRYAPGEKYYQSMDKRRSLTKDAPIFRLVHTWAPAGVFGTRWGVNKTEISIDKRWWFSAWGHLDTRLGAGHVWNKTVFTSLLIPNTNVSYFIQGRAFSLMNPLEFVNDTYAEVHLTYSANGALLNYIPLVKKLKLREIIGIHSIWGRLSNRNNPSRHPDLLEFPLDAGTTSMGRVPYVELNVGLDNIFRLLRVDYVCRLTHNGPGLPRHGVRFGLHFTF